jgi:RNA polymerase sigma factor (TIGR02999 family)
MPPAQETVTQLLIEWREGDETAINRLMPLVYHELRRMAHRYMRRERPGHMLQTTALINEAYLKLVGNKEMQWQNRSHFYAVAAQAMRRILVDNARARRYAKRGGGAVAVELNEAATVAAKRAAEIVALDDALNDLAKLDPRKSRIVELRYFGGMTVVETAEVLDLSPATVMRDWDTAKAWLLRAISPDRQQKKTVREKKARR